MEEPSQSGEIRIYGEFAHSRLQSKEWNLQRLRRFAGITAERSSSVVPEPSSTMRRSRSEHSSSATPSTDSDLSLPDRGSSLLCLQVHAANDCLRAANPASRNVCNGSLGADQPPVQFIRSLSRTRATSGRALPPGRLWTYARCAFGAPAMAVDNSARCACAVHRRRHRPHDHMTT